MMPPASTRPNLSPDTLPDGGSNAASVEPAAAAAVRLDSNLAFEPCCVDGVQIVRAHHRVTNAHYQFGPTEHHVAMLLDHCDSLEELLATAQVDGVDWDAERLGDFIQELVRQGLARPESNGDATPEPSPPPAGPSPHARALRAAGWVISLRFPLCSPHRVAQRLANVIDGLPAIIQPLIAAGVLATLGVAGLCGAELTAGTRTILDAGNWVGPMLLWAALKVVHELGHAVAAAARGVRVGRGGVMFFMMAPIAYVDVSDAWRLPHARDRILIAAGGIAVELTVAAVAFWVWWLSPVGQIRQSALSVFLLAGPATLLVNANPLLRLDGYYILSDLTGIANLREHGRRLLAGALGRPLGLPAAAVPLDRRRRRIAMTHAVASVVFQIVWMGGLVIALIRAGGTAGAIMAAVATGLWVVLPVAKFAAGTWGRAAGEDATGGGCSKRLVVATVGFGVAALLVALGLLPTPLPRSVPVVVRYADEQTLRAPADAFVIELLVRSGDRVEAGQPLVQLRNDDLTREWDEAESELAAAWIEHRRHQHAGELALAQSSRHRADSLRRRALELGNQVESLLIRAGHDGVVVTPNLRRLRRRFVTTGDVIVRIGQADRLELLASIDQRDDTLYRRHVATGLPLRGQCRSGTPLNVHLVEAAPGASRQLPEPSLAATAGGLVAVTITDAETGPLAVTARRQAILPITPAAATGLSVGQTGVLWLRSDEPAWRRAWAWVRDQNAS